MVKKKDVDIVVIGGGTYGHVVARQIAITTSHKVCLARLSDTDRPRAASKRNHGWRQSGLYYYNEDKEAAAKMQISSNRLHEACGIRPCEESGIFGIASAEEADQLKRAANALFLDIQELSAFEARYNLGEFFNPGYIYFWVPDTRLDQPKLMNAMARDMQQTGRVEFLELPPDKAITIERERNAYGGFLLKAGDELIDAQIVLVCAGFMIPTMFAQAGIPQDDLVVTISPLLRLPDVSLIKAPLFVDMTSSLSILGQPMANGQTCHIIGNRRRRPHNVIKPDDLYVTGEEVNSIINLLPPSWRSFALAGNFPVTAGPKVEPQKATGARIIKPWVFDASLVTDLSGLYAGVPVKATNSWWAMELLLEASGLLKRIADVSEETTVEYSLRPKSNRERPSGGWNSKNRMHWDYEDLDDKVAEGEEERIIGESNHV